MDAATIMPTVVLAGVLSNISTCKMCHDFLIWELESVGRSIR